LELKEKGNNFYKEKKYKNAIECYTNGLKDDTLKNTDKAILYLNRAVSYMNLYQQYQNEKFYSDSVKDAEESYMWNPNYAKAYYIMAKLFLLKNDKYQALKNIKIATSIDPNQ
jgi:tetratricopeptide (TPR) repeat protein